MPHLGAPILVLLLRCILLGGLISADPSIVPLVQLSVRSVVFWLVVFTTVALYLKASLTNPGVLKTCPSRYVRFLSAKKLLDTVPNNQVKGAIDSDSELSCGKSSSKRRGYYSKSRRAIVDVEACCQEELRKRSLCTADAPDAQKSNVEKKLAGNVRNKSRFQRYRGPFFGRKSRVRYSAIDSDGSWCAASDDSDAAIPIPKKAQRLPDFSRDTSSSGTDDDTWSSGRSSWRSGKASSLSSSASTWEVHRTSFSRVASYKNNRSDSPHDTNSSCQRVFANDSEAVPGSPAAAIELVATASRVQQNEYLKPTTADCLNADCGDSLDEMYSESCVTEKQTVKHSCGFRLPQMEEPKKGRGNKEKNSFLPPFQERLGQLGVPIHPGSSASATVGSVLTFAAGTAAAPAVFISVAAAQLVEKARQMPWSEGARRTMLFTKQLPFHLTSRYKAEKSKVENEEDIEELIPTGQGATDHETRFSHIALRVEPQSTISTTSAAERKVLPQLHQQHHMEASSFSCHENISLETTRAATGRTFTNATIMPRSLTRPQCDSPNESPLSRNRKASALVYQGILGQTSTGRLCQTRVELRFCAACSKFQPLRTKHCVDCGTCIRTMDHHCPWLGTCVGENNHCFFYWFLVFQAVELMWTLLEVFQALFSLEYTLDYDNLRSIISLQIYLIVEFIVMIFLALMVVCLLGYHTFLATANLTTWENIAWKQISYLRDLPERNGSPFSKGAKENLDRFCCPYPLRRWIPGLPEKNEKHGPDGELIWEFGEQRSHGCGKLCYSCCCDSD